jgi:hypothetical protein
VKVSSLEAKYLCMFPTETKYENHTAWCQSIILTDEPFASAAPAYGCLDGNKG